NSLTSEALREIASVYTRGNTQKSLPPLQSLSIEHNPIGTGGGALLRAMATAVGTNLTSLHLAGCGLSDVGVAAMSTMFSSNHCNVAYVELMDNNVADEGCIELARTVQSACESGVSVRLRHLGLRHNRISATGASPLVDACAGCGCQRLLLSGNAIGGSDITPLRDSIHNLLVASRSSDNSLDCLDCLDLASCQLTETDMSVLATAFENLPVAVPASTCALEREGERDRERETNRARSLRLSVSTTALSSPLSAKALKERFQSPPSPSPSDAGADAPPGLFSKLVLDNNPFGDNGGIHAATIIRSCPTITSVQLSRCYIGHGTLASVGALLAVHPCLTHLDLSDNSITDAAGCRLIRRLADSHLHSLYLDGNQLSDASGTLLGQVLRNHPSLSILSVRRNNIGYRTYFIHNTL
ncbi:hypothetical protein KIPB_009739, partial [Kipferlia bialata]